MDYTFTKLSEVESLSEVPEVATVIAEVDGEIKRIPSNGLGGAGIKTAIIKSSDYDEAIVSQMNPAAPSTLVSAAIEYSCMNMTFEEAYATMAAGEPLDIVLMLFLDTPCVAHAGVLFAGTLGFGEPVIQIIEFQSQLSLFWCADGILTSPPTSNLPK